MLKVVSINRCEGTGIIERIEGNGWDIDADRIELNGINAHIIEDLENRIMSLNGPAVEDLFKNLRDLLKENGDLKTLLDRDTTRKKYQSNLEKEKNVSRKLNEKCNKLTEKIEEQDECIRHLENDLKEKDAAIKALRFDKDHYKESCEILKRSIEEKEDHIKALDKYLGSKNAEIDELNNKLKKYDNTQTLLIQHNNEKRVRIRTLNKELSDKNIEIKTLNEKCYVLENRLTVADKLNPILSFISGAAYDNVNFAAKTLTYFIPDYDVTVSVSRKEGTSVEIDNPGKYDTTKEIIGWLRGMIENNTDYATKIFNKESKENIFSITFCKVPVEPEVVTNEQG